jgi:small subunit ribosomal protein S18
LAKASADKKRKTTMASDNSEIRYLAPPTVDVKKKKYCRFKKSGIKYIDYKDATFLLKFVNEQGKLLPRRLTGTSVKYQRKVSRAVKRARHLAILPYVADMLK